MPVAMALLRDVQNLCPREVLNFILDLIKYNDNGKNKVRPWLCPKLKLTGKQFGKKIVGWGIVSARAEDYCGILTVASIE